MKKLLVAIALLSLVGCQRGCQKMAREIQVTERTYEVTVFSGGDTIFHDRFKGIINGEKGTDGFYYFKNDTLHEISGDYILKSVD